MANAIELTICGAVVVALLFELFPPLAAAAEHAFVLTLVTVAAWPMYLAMTLGQHPGRAAARSAVLKVSQP